MSPARLGVGKIKASPSARHPPRAGGRHQARWAMPPADENRPWEGALCLSVPGTRPSGLCCPCLRLAQAPRTGRTGQESSTSAPNAAFNPLCPPHAQARGTRGARSGANTSSPCCRRASPSPPSPAAPAPAGFPRGSPPPHPAGSPHRPPRPQLPYLVPLSPRQPQRRVSEGLCHRVPVPGDARAPPERALTYCPTRLGARRRRAWRSCPGSPGPGAAGPICSARLLPGALAARGDAARGSAGFLGQAAEEAGRGLRGGWARAAPRSGSAPRRQGCPSPRQPGRRNHRII